MGRKQMVAIYPIRHIEGKLEHLIIKRATPSFNWQCVTGKVEVGETPLQAAHRELFEETGYKVEDLRLFNFPNDFLVDDEQEGERADKILQDFIDTTDMIVFTTVIQDSSEPIIDQNEHTDWKWTDYPTAYEMIKWSIEKKQLRIIHDLVTVQRF